MAASTYHWSVSHGSITTPERSPKGVGMTRSSTRTSAPSSSSIGDDRLARVLAGQAEQVLRDQAVLRLDDVGLRIEHVEHVGGLEPGALADLIIVEVVARRDLDRAEPSSGSACSSAMIGIRRPVIGCLICLPISAL